MKSLISVRKKIIVAFSLSIGCSFSLLSLDSITLTIASGILSATPFAITSSGLEEQKLKKLDNVL